MLVRPAAMLLSLPAHTLLTMLVVPCALRTISSPYRPTDTYVRMLAVTKVWLATTEKGDHASTRFFEVLISGRALLLCDRNPTALAPLGIVEGEHAAMFNTTDELLGTLQYYLEHEEERERLVRNARALALRRHLWRHRAATLARHVRGALRGARHDRQHRVNAV